MLLQGAEARSDLAIEDIDAPLEVLPEALDRVQLGAIGWQPHQDNVVRYLDALRHMRWGLIQQNDIETLGIVLTQPPEEDTETVGIQAWQFPPEGVPCGGLHGGIQPVIFIERLHNLERFDPIAGEPTAERQVEPEPAFVLAEDPHGLRRGLPASGRNRPEAAGALFDKVSRLSDVFFAWLGRGRLSFALSW